MLSFQWTLMLFPKQAKLLRLTVAVSFVFTCMLDGQALWTNEQTDSELLFLAEDFFPNSTVQPFGLGAAFFERTWSLEMLIEYWNTSDKRMCKLLGR